MQRPSRQLLPAGWLLPACRLGSRVPLLRRHAVAKVLAAAAAAVVHKASQSCNRLRLCPFGDAGAGTLPSVCCPLHHG